MPFQMTQRSMTLTLTFVLKIAFLDFVAAGGIVSVSQTPLGFFLYYLGPALNRLYHVCF